MEYQCIKVLFRSCSCDCGCSRATTAPAVVDFSALTEDTIIGTESVWGVALIEDRFGASRSETVKGDWPHNSGVFQCGAGLASPAPQRKTPLLCGQSPLTVSGPKTWCFLENLAIHYFEFTAFHSVDKFWKSSKFSSGENGLISKIRDFRMKSKSWNSLTRQSDHFLYKFC